MTPAEQIKALRHSTGLSQAAFGRVYEIPRRTIQNWENGVNVPPPYLIRLLELAVQALPPEKLGDPE